MIRALPHAKNHHPANVASSAQGPAAWKRFWTLVGLGLVVVASTLAGLGGLWEIKSAQRHALDQFTRQGQDNADWAIYQLELERAKLESVLLRAKLGDPSALAGARQRYEIFASRMPILGRGASGESARKMSAFPAMEASIEGFLARFDPHVEDGLATDEIDPMLTALDALQAPIRELAIETMHARADFDRDTREKITLFEREALAILGLLIMMISGFAGYSLVGLWRAHRSEERLRESQKRLLDFAHVASDWYWESDADHALIYVSETERNMDARPMFERGLAIAGLVRHDPANGAVADNVADKMAKRKPFRDCRFKAPGQDGELRHLSISGAPFFSAKGRFLGYRGTVRDVTQAIETERSLSAALEEARIANNAKLAFLANMSHELRTPLNAIIGFAETLQIFAKEQLDQRQLGYLSDIRTSGQHLLGLINSILEIAKMDVGRIELSKEPLSVAEVAAESERMLDSMAMKSGVTIKIDKNLAGLPMVSADRLRLRQVFLNLISNSIKYTPEGGEIRVTGECRPAGMISISVIDEGIGMRPEDIATALRPFERIISPLMRNREGIGLGLPIADSLVREHGGELSISSMIGRGTSVTVRLPIAGATASAVAIEAS